MTSTTVGVSIVGTEMEKMIVAIRIKCLNSEINSITPLARSIAFDRNLDFVNQSHRLVLTVLLRLWRNFEATLVRLFLHIIKIFLVMILLSSQVGYFA